MINNENSYYSKYLKYKKKYLDIKQLIGGDLENGLEEKKRKEDVLTRSIGAALYINSFELLNEEPFCNLKLEEMEPSKSKKIIQFNNKNVIHGSKIELEQYKETHSNWENTSFGEIKKLYKTDIDEYCKLYQNEFKSDLDEDAGLYGQLDDKQTKKKMEDDIEEEEEENNVANLFNA